MRQYFGIDPETGYKMFVDTASTLRLELPICPCCGGEGLLSHTTKYGGEHVCKSCGDKWAAYISARSRLNVRSTHRILLNQLSRLNYWISVKDAGRLAPAGLEQDKANIQNYMRFYGLSENIKPAENLHASDGRCYYCGKLDSVQQHSSRPRCPECSSRYGRYRHLQTHIKTLTVDECEEFGSILSEYADLMRRGFWAPNIPKYREKIRRRMDEIV